MTANHQTLSPTPNAEIAREQMILEHYPLVRRIAGRVARQLPPNVRVDDLVSAGVLGLISAVDRFDPDRPTPFKAYAKIRIHGAMIDELRQADWVPRSVRCKFNRIASVRNYLDLRRRQATPEATADFLGLTLQQLAAMELDSSIQLLVSLDEPDDYKGDDLRGTRVDRVPTPEPDALEQMLQTCTWGEVLEAIQKLPRKERIAVSLYYLQGMFLKEIGEVLNVGESRACQLRANGVQRLRSRLVERSGAAA